MELMRFSIDFEKQTMGLWFGVNGNFRRFRKIPFSTMLMLACLKRINVIPNIVNNTAIYQKD